MEFFKAWSRQYPPGVPAPDETYPNNVERMATRNSMSSRAKLPAGGDPSNTGTGQPGDARRERPCYRRDQQFLAWRAEGIGIAEIRDKWNSLSDEERKTICPTAANRIGRKDAGRETVKKGIEKARAGI
jgi:hypothetical protein